MIGNTIYGQGTSTLGRSTYAFNPLPTAARTKLEELQPIGPLVESKNASSNVKLGQAPRTDSLYTPEKVRSTYQEVLKSTIITRSKEQHDNYYAIMGTVTANTDPKEFLRSLTDAQRKELQGIVKPTVGPPSPSDRPSDAVAASQLSKYQQQHLAAIASAHLGTLPAEADTEAYLRSLNEVERKTVEGIVNRPPDIAGGTLKYQRLVDTASALEKLDFNTMTDADASVLVDNLRHIRPGYQLVGGVAPPDNFPPNDAPAEFASAWQQATTGLEKPLQNKYQIQIRIAVADLNVSAPPPKDPNRPGFGVTEYKQAIENILSSLQSVLDSGATGQDYRDMLLPKSWQTNPQNDIAFFKQLLIGMSTST